MKRLLSILVACALLTAQAIAAPAVVNTASGTAACTTTVALGSAPPAGNFVVAGLFGTSVSTGSAIKDSNSVSLSPQSFGPTTVFGASYTVTGSPTATYTFTATGTCQDEGLINFSGAVLGATGSSSSGSPSGSGALVGDIAVCLLKYTTTIGSGTLTISNAGTVTTLVNDTTNKFLMGYATITTAGTFACSGTGTGYANAGGFAFAATPPTSTIPKGCPPYPWSCAFQPG